MLANLIAFLWGFAEATLFFIVPDVALSIIALKGSDVGLVASLYALAGALTGGAVMFYWGKADIEKVTRILHRIPAIPAKDIQKVRDSLQRSGVSAIFFGPLFGIPYKIYASYAHLITTVFIFLLISIPARGVRFVLTALITPYLFARFLPDAPYVLQVQIVTVSWFMFYLMYFAIKRK